MLMEIPVTTIRTYVELYQHHCDAILEGYQEGSYHGFDTAASFEPG